LTNVLVTKATCTVLVDNCSIAAVVELAHMEQRNAIGSWSACGT